MLRCSFLVEGGHMLSDSGPVKIPGDSTEQEAYKGGYVAGGIAALIGTLEVAKVRVEEASDDE